MAFLAFCAFAAADALKTTPTAPVPDFLQGIVVPPASHELLDDDVALNLERAELIKSGLQELKPELCWGKDIMDPGTSCSTLTMTAGEKCQQFFESAIGHYKGTEYVRCEPAGQSKCIRGSSFCWHVYDKDASAEAGHYVDMTMGKKDLTAVKVAPDTTINYGKIANAKLVKDYYGSSTLAGGIQAQGTDNANDTTYKTDAKSPYLLVAKNAQGTAITERECKKLVGTQSGNNKDLKRAIRYTAFGVKGCHTYETYFKLSSVTWDAGEQISAAWFYDNPNQAVEDIYATGNDPNADVTSIGSGTKNANQRSAVKETGGKITKQR